MWFAPLLMVFVPSLNVLLGASTVPPHLIEPSAWAVPNNVWIVAAASHVILGSHLVARRESEPIPRHTSANSNEKVISLLSFAVAFLLLAGVFSGRSPRCGQLLAGENKLSQYCWG
jgi:hypothetical protein